MFSDIYKSDLAKYPKLREQVTKLNTLIKHELDYAREIHSALGQISTISALSKTGVKRTKHPIPEAK